MGSKASKTKRRIPVKAKAVVAPRLPQEIIDEILDHLRVPAGTPHSFDSRPLQSCALVSKSWLPSCCRLLFHTVVFTRMAMERWVQKFPVPEESPAHLVKDLYVWIGAHHYVPDKFYEYTPWFTNAKSLSLLGYKGVLLLQTPSLWRSPQSVTSLTVKTGYVRLVEIRDIIAELPNLNSLWLSGLLFVDRKVPQGFGKVLKGTFGGELRLYNGYTGEEITNMLLDIPTGIHFTEAQIEYPRKTLPPNVRLLEACGRTLVKLSYMVDCERGGEFERSLDFSKLPNLRVVTLKLAWMYGGLRWIPMALSTIKPATSPCLPTILVNPTSGKISAATRRYVMLAGGLTCYPS